MRYIQIDKAEKSLSKQYKIRAKNFKGGHTDFREVFKWITSPLIAREIGKPANLDGVFWVNCSFTQDEKTLLAELEAEINSQSMLKAQNNRDKKWKEKTGWV